MTGEAPKFVPQPRTTASKVRHINFTCSPERYGQLEQVAKAGGVSLKELIRQMVDFALANRG